MKLKISLIAIISCFFVSVSHAAPVWFQPGTLFEDGALTLHFDRDGDGTINVGDSIIGILEIDRTASTTSGGSSAAVPAELTGIFDAYVTGVTTGSSAGLVNFEFGANPLGFLDTTVTGSGVAPADSGLLAALASAQVGNVKGDIVKFYNGIVDNLDLTSINCLTMEDCLNVASNGTLYMSFGDNGDEDFNFTLLNGINDPAALAAELASTQTGSATLNLGLLTNNTGREITLHDCTSAFGGCTGLGDGKIEFTGSANFQGGLGLPVGALNRGDIQFVLTSVPEPGSLALLGLGLLGLGFIRKTKAPK